MPKTNRYVIALVAALGLIPVVIDLTIVTVALVSIRTDLKTDINTAQWIVTGFFLANAATITVGGYLANRFGRKRLFILGVAAFTAGSVACGLAPGIGWLIAFRVLQGIGGGILLPLGPALAFDAFPREERARASAVIGIPILMAPVFGPIIGGYLNDAFGWHSIFFLNVPFGILAVVAGLVALPRDARDEAQQAHRARFDYLGLALSTLGIAAIVYALKVVTQTDPSTVTAANPAGSLYGWSYWLVWALLGGGVVALGGFTVYALRISRDPALDLRQLGRRDFLVSNLVTWSTSLFGFGLLVLLPIYFEAVRLPLLSARDTGIALVPLGVGTLAGTIVATALYRAAGPRVTAMGGAACIAISAYLFAQTIHATADASQLLAAARGSAPVPAVAGPDALRWELLLLGLGIAIASVTVQTLALEALKGEALAKASSLYLSTKLLVSSIGVAIITTLLIDRSRSRAGELAGQLQALLAAANPGGAGSAGAPPAAALRAVEAQLAVQAGTWAIQGIFWLIFFASLGLVALALLLPGRQRRLAPAEQPADEPLAVAGM
ncbi:MAG: DHA2 family efflux MFS transporter permease subunit [Ktedonobacterales bacterium]